MTTVYKFKAYYKTNGAGAVQDPAPTCTVINMADDSKAADAQATTASTNMPGLYSYEYSGADGLDCVAFFHTTDADADEADVASYVSEKITTNLNADIAGVEAKVDIIDTNVDTIYSEMTDVNDILTPLAVVDGIVDAILADTGTDGVKIASGELSTVATASSITALDGKIDTIDNFLDTEVAAILADTDELQAELADGGRTDLLIDAIKAKTDTIIAVTAQAIWEYATRVLTAGTNIDLSALATATNLAAVKSLADDILVDTGTTLDALVKDIPTNAELTTALGTADDAVLAAVAAVKAETASILEDTGTTLPATLDTINNLVDTEVAAIKAKTDQLTFTTANKVDATAATTLDANALSTISGDVWSHPTRTLTNQGIESATPAAGDPLVIYRDTTVNISLTGLGAMDGYTKIWFTVKEDLEDLDTAAVLQIATTDGLKYLDGSSTVTDTDGTLVPDEDAGTAVITLQQASAALLPVYAAYPIPWDVKMLNGGNVTRLAEGTIYIKSTPTRSIT